MEIKKNYCSQSQKNMLIELLRQDQQLVSGKFTGKFSFKDAQKRWENISKILNAIPGALKDWKQWRKTWQDIRSKVKSKKAQISKYQTRTGGGPPPPPADVLSETDEKILSVLSPYVVVGSETVPETSVIHFDFDHDNDQTQEICDDHIDEHEVHEDHLYTKNLDNKENQDNVDKFSVPSTSKDKHVIDFAKAKPISKKKRTVAATRLLNSANATTILAETSKKDLELRELYYTKKLILLERQTTALEQLINMLKRDD